MAEPYNRKLVLETGEEFYGRGFGDPRDGVGMAVFDTSMVGYQQIVSDPTYAFQIVVMTYPVIGNYGICDDDSESRTPLLGGLVVRDYNDHPSNFRYTRTLSEFLEENRIPGLCQVDTRRLTRALRDGGSRRALITAADTPLEDALKALREAPEARDAVRRVSRKKPRFYRTPRHRFNVAAVDLGIKRSLVRCLRERGCNVTVFPCDATAQDIRAMHCDGVLFSNGPGDPKDAPFAVETARALLGSVPVLGVGLGHQVVALACGADTCRLACGHHGANHPVRCPQTGKLEITVQNHDYAVREDSLEGTGLCVTRVDLIDGSVEALLDEERRVLTAQYCPESAPGFACGDETFDRFIEFMREAKRNA